MSQRNQYPAAKLQSIPLPAEGFTPMTTRSRARSQATKETRLGLLEKVTSWREYMSALKQCEDSWRAEGVAWTILSKTCSYVHTITEARRVALKNNWIDLSRAEKTILLGLQDSSDGTWKLLGSLVSAGTVRSIFKNSETQDSQRILEHIRESVDLVLNAKDQDFPSVAEEALEMIIDVYRFGHGTGTRLLSLARPDRLVSINKRSCNGLAKIFQMSPTTLGEPKNYRLLLEKLYDRNWYSDQRGRRRSEQKIGEMRAALIDSFVYDPST